MNDHPSACAFRDVKGTADTSRQLFTMNKFEMVGERTVGVFVSRR